MNDIYIYSNNADFSWMNKKQKTIIYGMKECNLNQYPSSYLEDKWIELRSKLEFFRTSPTFCQEINSYITGYKYINIGLMKNDRLEGIACISIRESESEKFSNNLDINLIKIVSNPKRGYGNLLFNKIKELAFELNVYQINLNPTPDSIAFWDKKLAEHKSIPENGYFNSLNNTFNFLINCTHVDSPSDSDDSYLHDNSKAERDRDYYDKTESTRPEDLTLSCRRDRGG